MNVILWGSYQELHITDRHGVTAYEFEQAWRDRTDVVVRHDGSYESESVTDDAREVYLIWRWDFDDPELVFPITAFFIDE